MTTTETAPPADGTTAGDLPDELLAAVELFPDATQRALLAQPTFALLNPVEAETLWHGVVEGQHLLTINGVLGTFDLEAARFTPADPAPLRELLAARLTELHSFTAHPAEDPRYFVAWESAVVESEEGGALRVRATAAPVEDGPATDVVVTLDAQLAITDITLPPPPVVPGADQDAATGTDTTGTDTTGTDTTGTDTTGTDTTVTDMTDGGAATDATGDAAGSDGATAAAAGAAGGSIAERTGITAEYLGGYYGATELPAQQRWLTVDWTSWRPDQATDDGRVGSWVTATSAIGGQYRAYGWFDPASGITLEHPEELVAPPLGEVLGAHYAQAWFPFGDRHYQVVDWAAWHGEPTPTDQPYGSYLHGTTEHGGRYQLYVRYDPGSGVEIVLADELEPPTAGALDPAVARQQFDELVAPELRARWDGDREHAQLGDRKYDVTGFFEGASGCELVFTGHVDGVWHATLGAVTAYSDERRPVTCELAIRSADDVTVVREDDRH